MNRMRWSLTDKYLNLKKMDFTYVNRYIFRKGFLFRTKTNCSHHDLCFVQKNNELRPTRKENATALPRTLAVYYRTGISVRNRIDQARFPRACPSVVITECTIPVFIHINKQVLNMSLFHSPRASLSVRDKAALFERKSHHGHSKENPIVAVIEKLNSAPRSKSVPPQRQPLEGVSPNHAKENQRNSLTTTDSPALGSDSMNRTKKDVFLSRISHFNGKVTGGAQKATKQECPMPCRTTNVSSNNWDLTQRGAALPFVGRRSSVQQSNRQENTEMIDFSATTKPVSLSSAANAGPVAHDGPGSLMHDAWFSYSADESPRKEVENYDTEQTKRESNGNGLRNRIGETYKITATTTTATRSSLNRPIHEQHHSLPNGDYNSCARKECDIVLSSPLLSSRDEPDIPSRRSESLNTRENEGKSRKSPTLKMRPFNRWKQVLPAKDTLKHTQQSFVTFISPVKSPFFQRKSTCNDPEDITKLREEVSCLRYKIKVLDTDTGRNELLDLIKEKESENNEKDEKLKHLNAKLSRIQKGLSEIEKERQSLTFRVSRLEGEKVQLQNELDNRETEIRTLSKRCSEQAAKMKEANRVLSIHNDQTRELQELRKAFVDQQGSVDAVMQNLKDDLAEAEKTRDEIFEQLLRVKRDHDVVTASLRECIDNLRILTEEKRGWEEERERIIQEKDFEIEKLRLHHQQDTIQLMEDIRLKEANLRNLKQLASQRDSMIQTLQAKVTQTERSIIEESERMEIDFHERVASLSKTHTGELESMQQRYEGEISRVMSMLEVKTIESQHICDQRDEIINDLRTKLADLQSAFQTATTRIEAGFEERVASTVANYEESIKSCREKHELELSRIEESIKEKTQMIDDLRSQLEDCKSKLELESQKSKHEIKEKLGSKAELHEAEIIRLRRYYERDLTVLENKLEEQALKCQEIFDKKDFKISELQQELTEAKARSAEDSARIEAESSERVAALSRKHVDDVVKMQAQYEERLSALVEKVEETSATTVKFSDEKDATINSLLFQLADSKAQITTMVAQSERQILHCDEEHNRNVATLKEMHNDELSSLRKKLSEAEQRISEQCINHESDVHRLKHQLGELQGNYDKSQAEFHEKFSREVSKYEELLNTTKLDFENRIDNLLSEKRSLMEAIDRTAADNELIVQSLNTRLSNAINQVELEGKNLDVLTTQLSLTHNTEINKLKDLHNNTEAKLESDIRDLVLLLAEKDNQLQDFKTRSNHSEEILRVSIKELQEQITNERSGFDKRSAQYETELSSLKSELGCVCVDRDKLRSRTIELESMLTLEQANNGKLIESQKIRHDEHCSTIQALCEEQLEAMRGKVHEKSLIISSLEDDLSSQLQKLMLANSKLERLESDSSLVENLAADIEALELERCSLQEVLHEKDMNIAELSAEILKLEIEKEMVERNLAQSKAQLASLTNDNAATMQRLDEELSTYCGKISELQSNLMDVQSESEVLKDDLAKERQRIESLEAMVKEVNENRHVEHERSVQHALTLENELSEKKTEIHILQNDFRTASEKLRDLSRQLEDSKMYASRCEREMLLKDRAITELRTELDNARKSHNVAMEESRKVNQKLQDDNRSLKKELALRDDEIRDLRVVELFEKQEVITCLEQEKKCLERELATKSKQYETSEAALKADIDLLRNRLATVEQRKMDRCQDLQSEIERHLRALSDGRREIDYLSIQLKDKEKKLKDASDHEIVLSRKVSTLEVKENELRKEYHKRLISEEELRSERDSLKLVLGRQVEERDEVQKKYADLNRLCDTLREKLTSQERQLGEQRHQIGKLENDLRDRTNLMEELIQHNRSMEANLETSASNVEVANEELQILRRRLVEAEAELTRSRTQWGETEHILREQLDTERGLLDETLSDLEKAHERLNKLMLDAKDVTEMEKENQQLKDKVRRQEAYLKRKLEKEKSRRARQTVPQSGIKKIPNTSSKLRKSWSSPPSIDRTESTDDYSLDSELESLLAD